VICKEDGVQFAGLGDAGQPAIVFDVGNGADVRFRQPPCGLVLADIAQECVEVELAAPSGHLSLRLLVTPYQSINFVYL